MVFLYETVYIFFVKYVANFHSLNNTLMCMSWTRKVPIKIFYDAKLKKKHVCCFVKLSILSNNKLIADFQLYQKE